MPSDVRGAEMKVAMLTDLLAARDAEIAETTRILADPVSVHINMLAGKIARPDWGQIMHLYSGHRSEIVAQRDAAREALRLAAKALVEAVESDTWTSGFEDEDEAREFALRGTSATALRAIVAILPDALDGAPDWVRKAVADTAPATIGVDGRIGADSRDKEGRDED